MRIQDDLKKNICSAKAGATYMQRSNKFPEYSMLYETAFDDEYIADKTYTGTDELKGDFISYPIWDDKVNSIQLNRSPPQLNRTPPLKHHKSIARSTASFVMKKIQGSPARLSRKIKPLDE